MADADRDLFRETGGACRASEAACRQIECRHNLRDPTRAKAGDKRGRRLHLPLWDCALAAADEGPIPAEDIARCLGVTRSRVGQIEKQAKRKVRLALACLGEDAA